MKELINNIRGRHLKLTVLGSGYVGLPTAALFAKAGFYVTAIDKKPEVVTAVNNGASHINEPGLCELVSQNVKAGRLKAKVNNIDALKVEGAIIISVQTPINENKRPNLGFLIRAVRNIGKNLNKGMLVVIGSTIPPGTMATKVKPILESLSNLKADEEFYLAYVPERIAPGKALKEFVESPRLVGGIGNNSTRVAAELFGSVCKKVIETNAAVAEVAKVAENTYRDVNIAFANELALLCEKIGVDVIDVVNLANTHPRVNIHMPGPGVGGPCLPKDPYLLINSSKKIQNVLIKTARRVNDYMPKHIVELTLSALRETGKDIKKSKIAILGAAYKNNVDDSRLSPSEKVSDELFNLCGEVRIFDPCCNASFRVKKVLTLTEALKDADCLVIMTDHKEFFNLDIQEISRLMGVKPAIVDGRRIMNNKEVTKYFFYSAVGLGKSNN